MRTGDTPSLLNPPMHTPSVIPGMGLGRGGHGSDDL